MLGDNGEVPNPVETLFTSREPRSLISATKLFPPSFYLAMQARALTWDTCSNSPILPLELLSHRHRSGFSLSPDLRSGGLVKLFGCFVCRTYCLEHQCSPSNKSIGPFSMYKSNSLSFTFFAVVTLSSMMDVELCLQCPPSGLRPCVPGCQPCCYLATPSHSCKGKKLNLNLCCERTLLPSLLWAGKGFRVHSEAPKS